MADGLNLSTKDLLKGTRGLEEIGYKSKKLLRQEV
jgi:hypothetical protein